MTLDELTQLTEALTHDYSIQNLRAGGFPPDDISDEDYVLLIRFLGGERVTAPPAPEPFPTPAPRERRPRRELSPEEQQDRLLELDELERREAPARAVDLGDGVILGFSDD